MFHRLKRQRKLTVKALQTVLVPALTMIDLEGVFLTNNIMRTLYQQCPHLKAISFKGCGYIITDTVLTQIAKVGCLDYYDTFKLGYSNMVIICLMVQYS